MESRTRGHKLKIKKPHCKTRMRRRQRTFAVRSINDFLNLHQRKFNDNLTIETPRLHQPPCQPARPSNWGTVLFFIKILLLSIGHTIAMTDVDKISGEKGVQRLCPGRTSVSATEESNLGFIYSAPQLLMGAGSNSTLRTMRFRPAALSSPVTGDDSQTKPHYSFRSRSN